MTDESKLKLVAPDSGEDLAIEKPGGFSLNKFKTKRASATANLGTLLTALPHHSISQAKDFVRLHPDEANYWSPELVFVSVPIKNAKREQLHLIEEDLAMAHLPSGRVMRFRLALASKPNNVFFLCHVPSRNEDNPWNLTNLQACEQAKTLWTQASSRRDSLGVIARAKLPIGHDGRNRPSLFPFGAATGRNAHSKSLYNAHAAMRSFMVFPPDTIAVYLDWRTQEVGVAAALSGDQALMDSYNTGDVYHVLALQCGLTTDTDRLHWKKYNRTMRDRMKTLQLGINYGMGVPTLAKGLDRHPIIASNLLEQHRQTYHRFWQWRDDQVNVSMLDRNCESVFGWKLHIATSPNKRTLYNFPMQANGAEMLRLAAWQLCEAGLVPSMLVHDGILLELRSEEEIAHAIEIMRGAGRAVCDGFEIGIDIEMDQRVHGPRYYDKRPVAVGHGYGCAGNCWG
jgi:hypothetical protein